MSELKQRLLKIELAKVGFPNADYVAEADVVKLQPDNERLPEINNAGDVKYGTEYDYLAAYTICPLVHKVNEIISAWENSRPAPFDKVSQYNILAEYNDIVLAARDDEEYGRGLHFVTWKYDEERTEFYDGRYTEDFAEAKESFALRAGLIQKEKIITQEQAADIKAAVDFSLENCQSYSYAKRLTDINEALSTAYPQIFNEKETSPSKEGAENQKSNDKKPTLQDKLDTAKKIVQQADAQKGDSTTKTKKSGERE